MTKYKWMEKYTIFKNDYLDYFGEYKLINNNPIPCGTALLRFEKGEHSSYLFVEDYTNEILDGMFMNFTMKDPNRANSYLTCGIYKNDKIYGPLLTQEFDRVEDSAKHKRKYFDINLQFIDENGLENGPIIFITPKNEYYIRMVKDGELQRETIYFKDGKLCMNYVDNDEDKPFKKINCGWDFEAIYSEMKPHYYLGAYNKGFKPAFVQHYYKGGKVNYIEYSGAVMTLQPDHANYEENYKGERTFTDRAHDFAIMPYNQGKYFGNIVETGKNGNYQRDKIGCYRAKNDNSVYIGEYQYDYRNGVGIVYKDDVCELCYQAWGKKSNLCFEIHKNHIFLKTYDKGEASNTYYKIDLNTFNVDYYKNGAYKDTYDFLAVYEEEKEENNYENLISPRFIGRLKDLELLYRVDQNKDIYVYGCNVKKYNKSKKLFIPGFVTGIDPYAFKKVTNLEEVTLENDVAVIGDHAFMNCKRIKKLELSRSIEVFEPYCFESNDLTSLNIPIRTKVVKSYSFINCSNLKSVHFANPDTIVEEHAFPRKTKLYGLRKEEEEVNKEGKEKSKFKIKNPFANLFPKSKPKKERRKIDILGILRTVGEAILSALLCVPKFFVNLFDAIADFFRYSFMDGLKSVGKVLLTALLFIPKCVGKFFVFLFDKITDIRIAPGTFLSLITIVLGVLTLVFGYTGITYVVNEFASDFVSVTYPSLFGFPLTNLLTQNVIEPLIEQANLNHDYNFLLVLACLLYVITGPIDFVVINGLVLIGYIIILALYFVIGMVLIYGAGLVINAPAVVSLVDAGGEGNNKVIPIFCLLVGIACSVIYYINMDFFYSAH